MIIKQEHFADYLKSPMQYCADQSCKEILRLYSDIFHGVICIETYPYSGAYRLHLYSFNLIAIQSMNGTIKNIIEDQLLNPNKCCIEDSNVVVRNQHEVDPTEYMRSYHISYDPTR